MTVPGPVEDARTTVDTLRELVAPASVRLRLLPGFELLFQDRPVDLPVGARRLLAYLALADSSLERSHVAFTLWADKNEERAFGNLRSALWRVRQTGLGLIELDRGRLRLGRDVSVDVRLARLVLGEGLDAWEPAAIAALHSLLRAGNVLEEWYEDWLEPERERFRQVRLHGLERLSEQLLERGRAPVAIEVALAAVAAEPLRESAHRILVRAHLSEGNAAEALRQYERYRALAFAELGILPSNQLERLIAPLSSARRGAHNPIEEY